MAINLEESDKGSFSFAVIARCRKSQERVSELAVRHAWAYRAEVCSRSLEAER